MPIEQLAGKVHAPHEADDFVPPPRFADKTFERYETDPAVAGQVAAVERVRGFATAGRPRLWQLGRRGERQGLYLDGDFGVGKTHLLAAAWHAAGGTRRYLSFSEAISLTILLGPERCAELLAGDLVCIDEFELDDPSNTRLADLLLEHLLERGSRIVMTSNTVPGELGAEHAFVRLLRRQLQRVAERFDDVHVPGHDYRQRFRDAVGGDPPGWGPEVEPFAPGPRTLALDARELDRFLERVPVVSLRRVATGLDALTITAMRPWDDQLSALRFVHLVDRLYDWRVPLRVVADCAIDQVFRAEYRDSGFRKKYRRCESRLVECCYEGADHGR